MLNERSRKVLEAVVKSYIMKPEPVGSRYVTRKYGFNLSPATIRNIMADLEEMGFLVQPHTSAGRIPTDMGYRFYVDSLAEEDLQPDGGIERALKKGFEAIRNDVNRLIEEATRTVSEAAHTLVFAMPIKPDVTTLNRIQLFRYRKSQTVAVVLTDEGLITNKILDSDFGLTQRELNRISDYLNSEFSGRTVDEIRSELKKQISRERLKHDILISKAVEICCEALNLPCGEIIMSGVTELLGHPEFASRIDEIARAIEDKQRILMLLDRLSESEGVRTVIGAENPDKGMRYVSIIMADYRQRGRMLGSVGVIGPTRMDYRRVIPMVDALAGYISSSISRY